MVRLGASPNRKAREEHRLRVHLVVPREAQVVVEDRDGWARPRRAEPKESGFGGEALLVAACPPDRGVFARPIHRLAERVGPHPGLAATPRKKDLVFRSGE